MAWRHCWSILKILVNFFLGKEVVLTITDVISVNTIAIGICKKILQ